MIGLLQRVIEARVTVDGVVTGEIGCGLMVLIGVERADTESEATHLLKRLLGYRVFADDEGKMNRSLSDTGGGLLLVPQFTLVADTQKGTRPGFSKAAAPREAERLFAFLQAQASESHHTVAFGRFGADMKVALTNDGPVTFWLRTAPQDT